MAAPRWMIYAAVIAVALALIPVALIARARSVKSQRPRVAPVQNMASQQKFKPQSENPLFADGRAMRWPVDGAVARGAAGGDEALETGRAADQWVEGDPLPASLALMQRGRDRFDVFCAPCHGLAGYGDGLVARRAEQLQEGSWVPPTSMHDETVRQRANGHIYNTITNGIRTMPGYGSQISRDDRWAIVAYVRALQRSQNARPEDLPPEQREGAR